MNIIVLKSTLKCFYNLKLTETFEFDNKTYMRIPPTEVNGKFVNSLCLETSSYEYFEGGTSVLPLVKEYKKVLFKDVPSGEIFVSGEYTYVKTPYVIVVNGKETPGPVNSYCLNTKKFSKFNKGDKVIATNSELTVRELVNEKENKHDC